MIKDLESFQKSSKNLNFCTNFHEKNVKILTFATNFSKIFNKLGIFVQIFTKTLEILFTKSLKTFPKILENSGNSFSEMQLFHHFPLLLCASDSFLITHISLFGKLTKKTLFGTSQFSSEYLQHVTAQTVFIVPGVLHLHLK